MNSNNEKSIQINYFSSFFISPKASICKHHWDTRAHFKSFLRFKLKMHTMAFRKVHHSSILTILMLSYSSNPKLLISISPKELSFTAWNKILLREIYDVKWNFLFFYCFYDGAQKLNFPLFWRLSKWKMLFFRKINTPWTSMCSLAFLSRFSFCISLLEWVTAMTKLKYFFFFCTAAQ